MTICPMCEKGKLLKVKEKHMMYGIDLGTYDGEKCPACGEVFTAAEAMRDIEKIAKEKGIWGLGKKTKVTRTGNSLAIRIPKEIAQYLDIHEGTEAYIHPEKNKVIIEPVTS